jgi:hypothetical protein
MSLFVFHQYFSELFVSRFGDRVDRFLVRNGRRLVVEDFFFRNGFEFVVVSRKFGRDVRNGARWSGR